MLVLKIWWLFLIIVKTGKSANDEYNDGYYAQDLESPVESSMATVQPKFSFTATNITKFETNSDENSLNVITPTDDPRELFENKQEATVNYPELPNENLLEVPNENFSERYTTAPILMEKQTEAWSEPEEQNVAFEEIFNNSETDFSGLIGATKQETQTTNIIDKWLKEESEGAVESTTASLIDKDSQLTTTTSGSVSQAPSLKTSAAVERSEDKILTEITETIETTYRTTDVSILQEEVFIVDEISTTETNLLLGETTTLQESVTTSEMETFTIEEITTVQNVVPGNEQPVTLFQKSVLTGTPPKNRGFFLKVPSKDMKLCIAFSFTLTLTVNDTNITIPSNLKLHGTCSPQNNNIEMRWNVNNSIVMKLTNQRQFFFIEDIIVNITDSEGVSTVVEDYGLELFKTKMNHRLVCQNETVVDIGQGVILRFSRVKLFAFNDESVFVPPTQVCELKDDYHQTSSNSPQSKIVAGSCVVLFLISTIIVIIAYKFRHHRNVLKLDLP